jgi:hypothetical protein
VVASLAIILLLVPVVALNVVQHILYRFIIVIAAATCFVMVISIASGASITEIFAAGAAYSAVLVVFISGVGAQSPKTTWSVGINRANWLLVFHATALWYAERCQRDDGKNFDQQSSCEPKGILVDHQACCKNDELADQSFLHVL